MMSFLFVVYYLIGYLHGYLLGRGMYVFIYIDREKKRRNVKEKRIVVIGWRVSKRGEQTR